MAMRRWTDDELDAVRAMRARGLTLWTLGDEGVHSPDFRPSIYASGPQTLQ